MAPDRPLPSYYNAAAQVHHPITFFLIKFVYLPLLKSMYCPRLAMDTVYLQL